MLEVQHIHRHRNLKVCRLLRATLVVVRIHRTFHWHELATFEVGRRTAFGSHGLGLLARRHDRRMGLTGLDCNTLIDLLDDLVQGAGRREQRAGVRDVVDFAEVLLHIRYHDL